jgi:N-acetylmuramoyl-L-alanine amidase
MPCSPPAPRRTSRTPRARRPRRATSAVAAIAALALAATAGYTVRPGDTLSGIAVQHSVTTSALAQANGITDPDRIVAGRTLTIPTGASASSSRSGVTTVHTVAAGETLGGIAIRYGVRSIDIASANGITDRNRIRVGQRLQIPGDGRTVQAAAGAPTATRAEVGALIERTARQHGWSPAFVKAIAWQESGWSNTVVSSAGARGIMQVMPDTGRFVSERLAGRTLDLGDPADNVLAGVLFLDYLHGLTGGDREMILAGYYQGLGSVRRNGIYPSTRQYIANVLALRDRF